ncbi:RagB/SusD family nutrient uptake outer membrane protein [Sphingobacterium sp. SYP-B4668]|uniref:RagB/SusD family nutrient uptake outer membrane protein n=1 Tax=Sphingobacterium sp. SYP-B4668 TaxID=2996035 RepID=UPI0022DCFC5A|nr:RagB/SusD family nutrient uptake outer membrane protein [Sphingobacterium sp. SYP-B4668]
MNKWIYVIGAMCTLLLFGCDSFLDHKPDIKMTIPASLSDADYLLDDYNTMNSGYPLLGEIGIDDYYVTKEIWENSAMDQRNTYTWTDEPYTDVGDWQRPYKTVYYANQVLQILDKLDRNIHTAAYNRNWGAAHFFRAFVFQLLTEIHCPAYIDAEASEELGIPLRLEAGVDGVSVRASLEDTYRQIVLDFREAARFLPVIENTRGRPSKSAAYAGLARSYLNMGDYKQAFLYADSCLQLNPDLMDYSSLDGSLGYPIPRFNVEVLFSATSSGMGIIGGTNALVADGLYASYDPHDLRKQMYFIPNTEVVNTYNFRGGYDQNSVQMFMGITTSEVYLIKAEAASRLGRQGEARDLINILLQSRWDKEVVYVPVLESDGEKLLRLILDERRKELLFRGRRWADLKRLNLENRFQTELTRIVGDRLYTLKANDPRYAVRLSETVVRVAEIPQNER